MITLYHIEGKKWGATKQKLSKRLRDQKLKLNNVKDTIVVKTEEEASILEEKLNKEYGYSWKKSENYLHMLEIASNSPRKGFTKEEALRGAKKGGKTAVESGQLASIQSMGGKIGGKINGKLQSQRVHTCPNCGKVGRGNGMVGHINRCK